MTKVNTPGLTEEWPHLRSFANGEVTMPKKWTTAVEIENAELRERIELLGTRPTPSAHSDSDTQAEGGPPRPSHTSKSSDIATEKLATETSTQMSQRTGWRRPGKLANCSISQARRHLRRWSGARRLPHLMGSQPGSGTPQTGHERRPGCR